MRKDKKDVQGTSFMKDEDGKILVEQKAVADRWERRFEQLLNQEIKLNQEMMSTCRGSYRRYHRVPGVETNSNNEEQESDGTVWS